MEQPVLQRQPRIGRHRHQRRRRQDRQRTERPHHRQPQRRLADLVVQRTAQDQLPARTPRPVSRPSAGHQIRGRGPVLPRLLLLPQSAHLRRRALLRPRARLDRRRRLQGARRPRLRDGPRAGRFRLRGPKPSGHVGERQHPRDEMGRAGLRQPRSALRGDVPQISRHGRRRQIPPAGGRHGQGVHHRLALLSLRGGSGTLPRTFLLGERQDLRGGALPPLRQSLRHLALGALQHQVRPHEPHAPLHEPLPHGRRLALHRQGGLGDDAVQRGDAGPRSAHGADRPLSGLQAGGGHDRHAQHPLVAHRLRTDQVRRHGRQLDHVGCREQRLDPDACRRSLPQLRRGGGRIGNDHAERPRNLGQPDPQTREDDRHRSHEGRRFARSLPARMLSQRDEERPHGRHPRNPPRAHRPPPARRNCRSARR